MSKEKNFNWIRLYFALVLWLVFLIVMLYSFTKYFQS
jgi:hypothetical protein